MNIYVLNPDNLNRLAVINTYTARNWNTVWGESGSFTIWAPITADNAEFLVEENLIWPDNQKCVGVIEHIHKYTSEDSSLPLIEVSGRFMAASYLSRRIIWGNVLYTNRPANIIAAIVRKHAIASTDANRRFGNTVNSIPNISSVPVQDDITYCNSYGNLWEEIKDISLDHGLSLEFEYDTERSTSDVKAVVYSGQDRSSEVNLSTNLGFLTNADYTWDSTDYCNVALVAGEGEGAERITISIIPSSATLRNRRELYVDARDLQKTSESTENPMSDEEYESALNQRGKQNLLEHPLYESYECTLQLTGEEGYIFGQDYNLGDIVTLTDHALNIQVQARVKEHQLSEDDNGRTDTLVFGISVPTITALIKRRN